MARSTKDKRICLVGTCRKVPLVILPILRCHLIDNLPSQRKVGHTKVVYVFYSLRTVVWFLCVPQFSSLSLKTRKYNSFAQVITKAALSFQLLKDPECWSRRGLDPRSPNWANQAVVKSTEILLSTNRFLLLKTLSQLISSILKVHDTLRKVR